MIIRLQFLFTALIMIFIFSLQMQAQDTNNEDPMVTGLPSTITVLEDSDTDVLDISAASISDVDAGSGELTLTLIATSGVFDIASHGGITLNGHLTDQLKITGNLTDLNHYINIPTNIYFRPPDNLYGINSAVVDVYINDNGNTGSGGGSDVFIGSIDINITPVNDAPEVSLPNSIEVTDGTNSALTDISFADIDAELGILTATISVDAGTLTAISQAGVTTTGSGTSSLSLSGSLDDLNNFLSASNVTFVNQTGNTNNHTISVSIDDNGNTGIGGNLTANGSAIITVLPQSPITPGDPGNFITTWKSNNPGTSQTNQITIPTQGPGYNYNVYWAEIGNPNNSGSATGIMGDHTITFPSAGTYQVEITGDFPRIFFNGSGDSEKILSIEQWGDIVWTSMEDAFNGASNLTDNAMDAPDLTRVNSFVRMFQGATAFNGNIGSWDVSGITNMSGMFTGANSFNQDIGSWNVSNVTNMDGMFVNAYAFNQDISRWQVGNVTNMNSMFRNAFVFNQDLRGWNVSKVTTMQRMFFNASAFNVNIGNWDVSRVTDMLEMLSHSGISTANYDSTLSGWASQEVQPNVNLGAQGLTYCTALEERQSLIEDHGWIITGDQIEGGDCGMVIYIRSKDGNIISVNVYGSDSFQQLKQKIQDKTGIQVDRQILYFNDVLLEDGRTLDDFDIQHGDTLDLIVNQIPTVANPIPDQQAIQDIPFSFQFAANTFTDADVEDELSYTARLLGGGNLPAWLSFEPTTRTFSGTPGNVDVGAIDIEVIADDGNGGLVMDSYRLTVIDRPGVTISTSSPSLINHPFMVEVVFSEAVTGFALGDFSITNGTASGLETLDNMTYQVWITPAVDGAVSVQVPENVALSNADAPNTASNELVLIYDQTDPQVVTRDMTIFLDASGMATIDADDIDNGSSDANGIASRELSRTTFDCSHIGENTIQLTVTDNSGNNANADASVTVLDSIAPVLDDETLADIVAQCEVIQSDLTPPTAIDNCNGSITATTDATFPITTQGTTTITWTYEDDSDNSISQTQDIIIEDNEPPVPDVPTLADFVAQCEVAQSDLAPPTATDHCSGIITATADVTFPITTPGNNTITWNYEDGSGNTFQQTQGVIIENIPPVIQCSETTIVSCNPIVTFDFPEANDQCGPITVTQTDQTGLTSGAEFPVGTTLLTFRAANAAGASTCTIEVEVIPELEIQHITGVPQGDTLHIADCLPPKASKANLDLGPHQNKSSLESHVYLQNLPAVPEFGLWQVLHYTYEVEDQCGNSDYFENHVALYDLSPPTFQYFPPDITIPSPSDLPPVPENVKVIDICRFVVWDTVTTTPITDPASNDTLAFIRRWMAEDEVGNKSFRDQMIHIDSIPNPDLSRITAHIGKEEDLIGEHFPNTAGADSIPVTLYKLNATNGIFAPVDTLHSGNWMGRRGNLFITSLLPGDYILKLQIPQGYTALHPDSTIYEDGWSDTLSVAGDSTVNLGTILLVPAPSTDILPSVPRMEQATQDVTTRNEVFSVYPNPTSGRIKVATPAGNTFDYTIYNNLGQAIRRGTAENGTEIDLRNQTNGMYFILIKNDDDFMETQRILLSSP